MADQKKRKLCKLKSTEEFSAVRKQPAVIHTSKLLEMLNWKKRSLRKKLSHNDELQAASEEDNRDIDPTKYFLEGPITREKNSLRVYAAPVKAAINSLASMYSRSFRKMIVRDDSPELEEIDALVDSPEVEMQYVAATNPRECLRSTIENELFSEVIPSPKKGPSFIGSLDNDYRSIVRYKLQKDREKAYVFKVMANLWRASKSRSERILDKN
ncbi:hypothetical protein TIFTF001_022656 [Ficus carica]|uniref:Uncharacterized protein n=1 Tax=Ficus carica TaxID=3494 RepID=A0AA88ATT4_FICCA|nr:hypothetical protein TIFTF001_022656 [Ficus carica]